VSQKNRNFYVKWYKLGPYNFETFLVIFDEQLEASDWSAPVRDYYTVLYNTFLFTKSFPSV